jgi:hypothetical protein
MKSVIIAFASISSLLLFGSLVFAPSKTQMAMHNGDILFINSTADNAMFMRKAAKFKFNHCGILVLTSQGPMILEVTPNKIVFTDYTDFLNKGNGTAITKRLKNRESYNLDTSVADFIKIREAAQQYALKLSDKYLSWNDSALYSSELVWKFYKEVFGIELCEVETLNDFKLKDQQVNAVLREGYGKKIPLTEKAISPKKIYNSKLLETIHSPHMIEPK